MTKTSDELNELGGKAIDDGLYSEAIDYSNQSLELDPKNALAYFHRGLAYDHLEDSERALVDYDRSIELDATNIAVIYNRANLHFTNERYRLAIKDYSTVIELDPVTPGNL